MNTLPKTALAALLSLSLSSVTCAAAPDSLMGYSEGAQVFSVTPVTFRVQTISDIIYRQVYSRNGVRGLKMTLLKPETQGLKPTLIYFPGGGFTSAARDKYTELRHALAKAGFVVAAIEYRTVPDRYPALVEDAKAAIRYLRAHATELSIDRERIGVFGDSAGGYLAEMVAMTNGESDFDVGDNLNESSEVQAAVSFYGISDLLTIGEGLGDEIASVHQSKAVTEALLINGVAFDTFKGASVFDTPEKAREASPLSHVDGNEPPLLLLHGAKDTLVSPLQSKKLYEALKAQGADAEYILLSNAGHGDLPWYQDVIVNKAVDFFKKRLQLITPVLNDGRVL